MKPSPHSMRIVLLVSILFATKFQSVLADSVGSGFLVSKSGHIVTCSHCVPKGSKVIVLTDDGYSHAARVLFRNDDLDIAGLKIEGDFPNFLPVGDSASLKILDPIFVFGFPIPQAIGYELSASKGSLNAVRKRGSTHLLQIDAAVNPGNSGGPILDETGMVIGIAVSRLDPLKAIKMMGTIPERVNFAVPSSVIRTELQRNRIQFLNTRKSQDLDAMRDLAAKGTVQIFAMQDGPQDASKVAQSEPEKPNRTELDLKEKTLQAAIDYILLGNSSDLEKELSAYSSKVDYYDQGEKTIAQIREDLVSLRSRWPERFYIIESVDQIGVDETRKIGTATMRFRYALFNGKKFYKGKADTFIVFDLSKEKPEAIVVREHKSQKTKG